MTFRQSLRAIGYLVADLVPWQAIAVARGRDWDAAVCAAADALADEESEYEVLEPPSPRAVVEPSSPLAPTARLNNDQSTWSMDRLLAHALEWCELPTIQPGPIASPPDHPDNK